MTDFTPPAFVPPKAPEWATLIPDRHPKFKVHRIKAHAYSAVNIVMARRPRGGIVYQLIDEVWVPVARVVGDNGDDVLPQIVA